MNVVLWTAFAITVLVLNVALHEWMHVVALRELGGDIKRAGIGLPIPPMLTINPRGRRAWAFTISPWLVGAYVQADDNSQQLIKRMGYRQRAWFAGAGVIINLVLAALLYVVVSLTRGNLVPALIGLAAAGLLWVLRKPVTWVLPLIGIPTLVLVAYALVASVGTAQGPVGVVQGAVSSTGAEALVFSFAISASVGLINTIPIFPFDGGRVMDAAIHKLIGQRAAVAFQVATGVVALLFVIYILGSDVWSVVTAAGR